VIVVHISNRSLDLQPIVQRTAEHFGWRAVLMLDDDEEGAYEGEEEDTSGYSSEWVLLTRNESFLAEPAIAGAAALFREVPPRFELWTDDQSDLFRVLLLDEDGWLAWLRRLTG
jgi:hypothetical protein